MLSGEPEASRRYLKYISVVPVATRPPKAIPLKNKSGDDAAWPEVGTEADDMFVFRMC